MSASPQDPNGAEMGPYGMRPMTGGMPTGPNPMVVDKNQSMISLLEMNEIFIFLSFYQQYHEPHLNHLQPMPSEISHHGSLNGNLNFTTSKHMFDEIF